MRISVALSGITRLGIDTSPFIYLVEKHPNYFARMTDLISHINRGSILGISASLTLTEVLTLPMKLNRVDLVAEYEDILLNSAGFRLISLDHKLARVAARLRAKYNLKTPDAIQIATDIDNSCQGFLTNDLGLKRVTELQILILDELESD